MDNTNWLINLQPWSKWCYSYGKISPIKFGGLIAFSCPLWSCGHLEAIYKLLMQKLHIKSNEFTPQSDFLDSFLTARSGNKNTATYTSRIHLGVQLIVLLRRPHPVRLISSWIWSGNLSPVVIGQFPLSNYLGSFEVCLCITTS